MGAKTGQIHGRDHSHTGTDPARPGAWFYATPLAPAPTPDDYVAAAVDNAPFEGSWLNAPLPDSSYSPLRWRFVTPGKVQIEGVVDGGNLGDPCVILPTRFRPPEDTTRVISSADGTRAMTASIAASGEVTVLANVVGSGLGASGADAGTYGDGTHSAVVTVDDRGIVTDISETAITGTGGAGAVEYDYVTVTSPLTVTATTDASAQSFITGSSVSYDGSTRIVIEVYAPYLSITANQACLLNLYDGSTDLGRIANVGAINATGAAGSATASVHVIRLLTPSNASHTYTIKAWKTGGTAAAGAGAGGTGAYMPAFMRITKA